jgi:hypothetical protein
MYTRSDIEEKTHNWGIMLHHKTIFAIFSSLPLVGSDLFIVYSAFGESSPAQISKKYLVL